VSGGEQGSTGGVLGSLAGGQSSLSWVLLWASFALSSFWEASGTRHAPAARPWCTAVPRPFARRAAARRAALKRCLLLSPATQAAAAGACVRHRPSACYVGPCDGLAQQGS
jgi:hypothetical protein